MVSFCAMIEPPIASSSMVVSNGSLAHDAAKIFWTWCYFVICIVSSKIPISFRCDNLLALANYNILPWYNPINRYRLLIPFVLRIIHVSTPQTFSVKILLRSLRCLYILHACNLILYSFLCKRSFGALAKLEWSTWKWYIGALHLYLEASTTLLI